MDKQNNISQEENTDQGQPQAQKQQEDQEQLQAQEQKPEQGQQADQEQPQAQEQKSEQGQQADQEQPQAQEQKSEQGQPQVQEQGGDKGTDLSEEKNPTLIQVLDLLKRSNLINMDMSMKALLKQVKSIQPDLPAEWGIIGDSGHWVLIWKREGS